MYYVASTVCMCDFFRWFTLQGANSLPSDGKGFYGLYSVYHPTLASKSRHKVLSRSLKQVHGLDIARCMYPHVKELNTCTKMVKTNLFE